VPLMRRFMGRRPFRAAGFLLLLASLLALGAGSAESTADARGSRPTVVLVHGAWADSSSWAATARELRGDGFRTVSPELALTSLADDVATVRAALDEMAGQKVLVAHSYGGMVISAAAYGRGDVVGLVYAAGFVPDQLDSILTLGVGYQQSEAFSHLAFTGAPFASPAYIAPDLFRGYFAQDLSEVKAALLGAHQRPINFPIILTPSGPVAWHTLPCWYAASGADLMIDPAEQAHMASRAGCQTITFADASHAGGITRHAPGLADLVAQAAAG
jgi:pimeloyl-ACP methyl ester carboxylesterase